MKNGEDRMDETDVLFLENYAAAQSLKNSWTRLASTNGCMMIALSRSTLTIKPHWFARWLICLLGLDLCHEIPVANITGVTEVGKWFGYGKVEVQFESADGTTRRLLLYLKNHGDFVEKARDAMRQ
jgi:hypothetical protein